MGESHKPRIGGEGCTASLCGLCDAKRGMEWLHHDKLGKAYLGFGVAVKDNIEKILICRGS